jgi:hypothetical protein
VHLFRKGSFIVSPASLNHTSLLHQFKRQTEVVTERSGGDNVIRHQLLPPSLNGRSSKLPVWTLKQLLRTKQRAIISPVSNPYM